MNRAKYISMLLNFLNLQAIIDLEDKTRDYFCRSFPFSLGEVIPSTLYNPWLQHQCEPSCWQMGGCLSGKFSFADRNPDFSKERAITGMCLSGVMSEPSCSEATLLVQFSTARSRWLSDTYFGIIQISG